MRIRSCFYAQMLKSIISTIRLSHIEKMKKSMYFNTYIEVDLLFLDGCCRAECILG